MYSKYHNILVIEVFVSSFLKGRLYLMSASNEKSRLNDSKRYLNENVKDNIAKIETKSSKYYNFHDDKTKPLLETQDNRSNKSHSGTSYLHELFCSKQRCLG